MDATSWLFNQAPAIVLLSIVSWVLWKSYQAQLKSDQDTTAWRAKVGQRLDDIESALTQQSQRIATVEYLVGLRRVQTDTDARPPFK